MSIKALCNSVENEIIPINLAAMRRCKNFKELRFQVNTTFSDIWNEINQHDNAEIVKHKMNQQVNLQEKPINSFEMQRYMLDLRGADDKFLFDYSMKVHQT
jgi:hypothetical protein